MKNPHRILELFLTKAQFHHEFLIILNQNEKSKKKLVIDQKSITGSGCKINLQISVKIGN